MPEPTRETEVPGPKITGQVVVNQNKDMTWWLDQWTLPDGTVVYERKITGDVRGQQGPATFFNPTKIDPTSKEQQEAAKQYQEFMEKGKDNKLS